jgi:short-subunit dehydrogenase
MPRPVAFVTGASSGLGAGLARKLALEGWAVGLTARRERELAEVAGTIRAAGGEASVHPGDVGDRAAVAGALRACREALGPIDLLVCNAGLSAMTTVDSFRADDVERVLRVNVLGAVYAIEAALPDMLARSAGHLVGVGSLTGYGGLPGTAAYSASKGALHNLFESLRLDLRRRGVAVTFITPGYVRTPLTARNLHHMPFLMDVDDAVERMMGAIRDRRALLSFPWPLAGAVWAGQILPAWLYDRLASRVKRDKRPPADEV